jgi:hypothetical protein
MNAFPRERNEVSRSDYNLFVDLNTGEISTDRVMYESQQQVRRDNVAFCVTGGRLFLCKSKMELGQA